MVKGGECDGCWHTRTGLGSDGMCLDTRPVYTSVCALLFDLNSE